MALRESNLITKPGLYSNVKTLKYKKRFRSYRPDKNSCCISCKAAENPDFLFNLCFQEKQTIVHLLNFVGLNSKKTNICAFKIEKSILPF